jgi:hypothetical protein
MKRIKGKLTYANVAATLSLFLVLSGGIAYAATHLPKNSVGAKQLKRGAVTPAKLAISTRATLKGATGAVGGPGPAGPVGPQGAAAPAGGVLPTGVTLRGTFGTGSQGGTATSKVVTTGVSFGGYRLSVRPAVHLVSVSVAPKIPAPPECPGSVANPEAAPGNLCVYLEELGPAGGAGNTGNIFVGDPTVRNQIGISYSAETGAATVSGDGRASSVGFVFSDTTPLTAEGVAFGTWAVTAP